MSEWTTLTHDIKSHPSHKDFVIVRLKVGGLELGADYLYNQFSNDKDEIIHEDVIDSWRPMTQQEKCDW